MIMKTKKKFYITMAIDEYAGKETFVATCDDVDNGGSVNGSDGEFGFESYAEAEKTMNELKEYAEEKGYVNLKFWIMVDDQPDDNKEHNAVSSRQKDINRLSWETMSELHAAVHKAMDELRGKRTLEAMLQSELYGELLNMAMLGSDRFFKTAKKQMTYEKKRNYLLKALYDRMNMFYHYAVAKGSELPGIKWHIEDDGTFYLNLSDCALNLEHSFEDPHADAHDKQRNGRLFSIGLNVPLLEREDPESEASHLYGEYDEFLKFYVWFDADKECRDIYPSEYSHKQAILDTLAQLDVIADMANNNQSNK